MKCQNCSFENPENVKFCVNCASELSANSECEGENLLNQEAANETANEILEETLLSEAPTEQIKSKKSKAPVIIISVVLALLLCGAGIFCYCFFSGPEVLDFSEMPLIYHTDKGTKYLLAGSDKGISLGTDDENPIVVPSIDGKYIFFSDNIDEKNEYFDLYYINTEENSGEKLLANDVFHYMISADGKYVVYVSKDGVFKAALDGEKVRYGDIKGERFRNLEYFPELDAFICDIDEKNIYCLTPGKQTLIAEGNRWNFYYYEDKVIFTVENTEIKEALKDYEDYNEYDDFYKLYIFNPEKDKKAKLVYDCVKSFEIIDEEQEEIYYINEDDELFYYDGEESIRILHDVAWLDCSYDSEGELECVFAKTYEKIKYVNRDVEDIRDFDPEEESEKILYSLYFVDGTKTQLLVEDTDIVVTYGNVFCANWNDEEDVKFFCFNGENAKEFDLDVNANNIHVVAVYDNHLFVLENIKEPKEGSDKPEFGTLVSYEITSDGVDTASAVEIADKITNFRIIGNRCEKLLIENISGETYIYEDGKTIKISNGFYQCLWENDDGVFFFSENRDSESKTFDVVKYKNGETTKIENDVKELTITDENTVYYIDSKNKLYKYDCETQKEVLIDKNCESLKHTYPMWMFHYIWDYDYEIDWYSEHDIYTFYGLDF